MGYLLAGVFGIMNPGLRRNVRSVIVANQRMSPRKAVAFHEGRGSQEGIFAERKTHYQMDSGRMDYIPARTLAGNPLYMFAGILAHNPTRELRIQLLDAHGRQLVQQSGTPSGNRPRLPEFRSSGGAESARGRQVGGERRHGRRHGAAPGLPCGEDGGDAR